QSLALWQEIGDQEQVAVNLRRLGLALTGQGRYGEAEVPTEEALALYEAWGDAVVTAGSFATLALSILGCLAYAQGAYARSADYLAEALARQQALGYTWAIGESLLQFGRLAHAR